MITKPFIYGGRWVEPNKTWNKWSIMRLSDALVVAQFPTKKMCREHIDKMNGGLANYNRRVREQRRLRRAD